MSVSVWIPTVKGSVHHLAALRYATLWGMQEGVAWTRRPWLIAGMLLGGACILWLGFFAWQVLYNVYLLKTGKSDSLTQATRKQFEASIGSVFANTRVTPQDIARIEVGDHPTLGNPKAKVHIVEFLDYDCPFCKKVAPIIRAFMEQHRDDAYLIVRDFPITELHPQAEQVAIAARCVFLQKQGDRYWRYADRLFASQDAHAPEDIRTYALQLGVDMPTFDACVASKQPLPMIQQSVEDGLAAGVNGTPAFFFNGVKIQGAIDADSLNVIFAEALERATASPGEL